MLQNAEEARQGSPEEGEITLTETCRRAASGGTPDKYSEFPGQHPYDPYLLIQPWRDARGATASTARH